MSELGNYPDDPPWKNSAYWQDAMNEQASQVTGDYQQPGYGPTLSRIRQAYAAQAVKQKDHIAAGLFALFLGAIGMHKFYLGYNSAGFIMMAVSVLGSVVTLGLAAAVMWVLAIIEGVIYFSKSQTEFDQTYVLHQRDWF